MEDQIRKFKEYKFHEDDNFKQLIQEIASTNQNILEGQHLELFRRKWYQEQIDPNFNINFDGNFKDFAEFQKQEDQTAAPQQQQQECTHQQQKNYSKLFWLGFYAEGYLKFCFLTSIFGFQFITVYIGFCICGLAIMRQLKMPKFSKDYFGKLIINEFFHNLCFLGLFWIFKKQRGIVVFLPIMIHCWLGLCECIYQIQGKFYSNTKRCVDLTRANRAKLLHQKNALEILLFFWLLIQLFRGQGNFFLLIFYFNYLRIKYIVNDKLKGVVDGWAAKGDQLIESPKNPRVVKYILRKIKLFLLYLVRINTTKNPNISKEFENKTK